MKWSKPLYKQNQIGIIKLYLDPYVNVTVGIKYLSELNKHFDECIPSTLTAYSHGPTITRSYSKNYIKTNFYVKRVYGNM